MPNLLSPYRFSVTGGGSISIEQNVGPTKSGSTISQLESASITIGSASDRLLVAVIPMMGNSGTTPTPTSVTFGSALRTYGTGTSMTASVNATEDAVRPSIHVYHLIAPSTGAGTVQVEWDANVRNATTYLYELSGIDQTTPVGVSDTDTSLSFDTSASVSNTNGSADAIFIGGGAHKNAATWTGSGFTEDVNDSNTASNDTVFSIGHEIKSSSTLSSWSWTASASQPNVAGFVEFVAA